MINKYIGKLESHGLAGRDDAVLVALDAGMFSNKPLIGDLAILRDALGIMNISSILFARPSEPYWSMMREVISYECDISGADSILPMDCETRTFFHDIPVIDDFTPEAIASALSRRKSAIIKDRGIVTYGTVTPEQAFVSFSSACFSIYVKYFHDALQYIDAYAADRQSLPETFLTAFKNITNKADIVSPSKKWIVLRTEPPKTGEDVLLMLIEAGRAVVSRQLVDSYFGNISCVFDNSIYISQTGSSLDELEGCIDVVPLDGSSSAGITASSELTAHRNIYLHTGKKAILHGHPKFSVIMSMYCKKEGCDRSICHKSCPEKRDILTTPIVPGEIGTGTAGLMNTVPPAMLAGKGVIVYGHGVFTGGDETFRVPFDMLTDIEDKCRTVYFRTVNELLEHLL
jgi:ribulose-5-phosphate 4-epimerase/fuculose-1-phosphate aldolase